MSMKTDKQTEDTLWVYSKIEQFHCGSCAVSKLPNEPIGLLKLSSSNDIGYLFSQTFAS